MLHNLLVMVVVVIILNAGDSQQMEVLMFILKNVTEVTLVMVLQVKLMEPIILKRSTNQKRFFLDLIMVKFKNTLMTKN